MRLPPRFHLLSICLPLLLPLPGCGPATHTLVKPAPTTHSASLPEPAVNEVVIVINHNSDSGVHAGIFAGTRLNDPSGTYVGKRREADPNWPGPSLEDYVEYQKEDGPRVELYRFRLAPEPFGELDARMAAAGPTPPLFCAAEVKSLIAGIGPFANIENDGWVSPAELGELLDRLTQQRIGECKLPDQTSC